ncbi:hypothetical protein M2140_002086 [Clostridiales Family XIII bacterium PM5-7]
MDKIKRVIAKVVVIGIVMSMVVTTVLWAVQLSV